MPTSCTGCCYLTSYVHKTEIRVSIINFVKLYDLYTVIFYIRAWTQERLKEGALATNHLFGPGGLEEQGHYHTEGVEEQYELMQKGYAIAIFSTRSKICCFFLDYLCRNFLNPMYVVPVSDPMAELETSAAGSTM